MNEIEKQEWVSKCKNQESSIHNLLGLKRKLERRINEMELIRDANSSHGHYDPVNESLIGFAYTVMNDIDTSVCEFSSKDVKTNFADLFEYVLRSAVVGASNSPIEQHTVQKMTEKLDSDFHPAVSVLLSLVSACDDLQYSMKQYGHPDKSFRRILPVMEKLDNLFGVGDGEVFDESA